MLIPATHANLSPLHRIHRRLIPLGTSPKVIKAPASATDWRWGQGGVPPDPTAPYWFSSIRNSCYWSTMGEGLFPSQSKMAPSTPTHSHGTTSRPGGAGQNCAPLGVPGVAGPRGRLHLLGKDSLQCVLLGREGLQLLCAFNLGRKGLHQPSHGVVLLPVRPRARHHCGFPNVVHGHDDLGEGEDLLNHTVGFPSRVKASHSGGKQSPNRSLPQTHRCLAPNQQESLKRQTQLIAVAWESCVRYGLQGHSRRGRGMRNAWWGRPQAAHRLACNAGRARQLRPCCMHLHARRP